MSTLSAAAQAAIAAALAAPLPRRPITKVPEGKGTNPNWRRLLTDDDRSVRNYEKLTELRGRAIDHAIADGNYTYAQELQRGLHDDNLRRIHDTKGIV